MTYITRVWLVLRVDEPALRFVAGVWTTAKAAKASVTVDRWVHGNSGWSGMIGSREAYRVLRKRVRRSHERNPGRAAPSRLEVGMSELTRGQITEWMRLAEKMHNAPIYERIVALCRALLDTMADRDGWKRLWAEVKDREADVAARAETAEARLALALAEVKAGRQLLNIDGGNQMPIEAMRPLLLARDAYALARAALGEEV